MLYVMAARVYFLINLGPAFIASFCAKFLVSVSNDDFEVTVVDDAASFADASSCNI